MKSARRGFWAEGEVKGVDPYDTVRALLDCSDLASNAILCFENPKKLRRGAKEVGRCNRNAQLDYEFDNLDCEHAHVNNSQPKL